MTDGDATGPLVTWDWAVRVDATVGGEPGPHVLECSSEDAALIRLAWWQTRRPEGNPALLRREVRTFVGPWAAEGEGI